MGKVFKTMTGERALTDKLGLYDPSHHEPWERAQAEWHRYGSAPQLTPKNAKVLSDFWQKGMNGTKTTNCRDCWYARRRREA
jgi:hypothetical protein